MVGIHTLVSCESEFVVKQLGMNIPKGSTKHGSQTYFSIYDTHTYRYLQSYKIWHMLDC